VIRHFQASDDRGAMMEALQADGVIVVENAVPQGVLDAMMEDLKADLAAAPIGGGEFFGGAMRRIHGLARRTTTVAEIITAPALTGLADGVLLENCRNYRIQVLGLFQVWQGGRLQPLHRDIGVYEPYILREPGSREILLSWIVAVSDFTAENGATRIVPGSHTWPRERIAREDEIVQAEMPRGSAVVYLGSVLHGAAVNTTDQPRSAIVSGYAVGWLRQEESQLLDCPPEAAARLPLAARQLLGYRAHTPILGWAEQRDPDDLLAEREPDVAAEGYKVQSLQNM
jgi:hypothetical protein